MKNSNRQKKYLRNNIILFLTFTFIKVTCFGQDTKLEYENDFTSEISLLESAKSIATTLGTIGLALALIPTVYHVATNKDGRKWVIGWIVGLVVFVLSLNLFFE